MKRDSMAEQEIQQISSYLSEAMPGAVVRRPGSDATHETVITVQDGECNYTLRIDPDFTAASTGEEIPELLRRWDVAGELLRSENMPLILTASGIRLASSN